jgi:hypothetical protein
MTQTAALAHPRRLRPARTETRNALSSVLRLARVPLRRRVGRAGLL